MRLTDGAPAGNNTNVLSVDDDEYNCFPFKSCERGCTECFLEIMWRNAFKHAGEAICCWSLANRSWYYRRGLAGHRCIRGLKVSQRVSRDSHPFLTWEASCCVQHKWDNSLTASCEALQTESNTLLFFKLIQESHQNAATVHWEEIIHVIKMTISAYPYLSSHNLFF